MHGAQLHKMWKCESAIINVSFTILQYHHTSCCAYVSSLVRMSTSSDLNVVNRNNHGTDRHATDDAEEVYYEANTGDSADGDNTVAWNIYQRPRRKKSSTSKKQNTNMAENSRRKITTDDAAPGWMTKLPYLIPPSTTTTSTTQSAQQEQQHILLLVGLPGSGKTTLATTLCRILPWKYMHVNQDILKSRPSCLRETQRILDLGKCPIIDLCNISKQQRQYFTQFTFRSSSSSSSSSDPVSTPTNTNVPVDCVVLQIASIQECIRRCQHRTDHPTLPPHQVHRVIGMMQHEWEEPKTILRNSHKQTKQGESLRSVITITSDTELQHFITTIVDTATRSYMTDEDQTTSTFTMNEEGTSSATTTTASNDTATSSPSLVNEDNEEDAAIPKDEAELTTALDTLTVDENKEK